MLCPWLDAGPEVLCVLPAAVELHPGFVECCLESRARGAEGAAALQRESGGDSPFFLVFLYLSYCDLH